MAHMSDMGFAQCSIYNIESFVILLSGADNLSTFVLREDLTLIMIDISDLIGSNRDPNLEKV
jgi:hypothetical protein